MEPTNYFSRPDIVIAGAKFDIWALRVVSGDTVQVRFKEKATHEDFCPEKIYRALQSNDFKFQFAGITYRLDLNEEGDIRFDWDNILANRI